MAETLEALGNDFARPSKFLLSVVVPCFNEQDVILLTYRQLVDVLGNRDFSLQIVIVDDGSAGLANADGDAVVVIDADLQDPPPRLSSK